MGIVLAATHLELDQTVALKFLRRERLGAARNVARFVQEARLAARLKSPHVARILDAGSLKHGSLVLPFIAFEYLEGMDLARLLSAGTRLAPPLAAGILVQAC